MIISKVGKDFRKRVRKINEYKNHDNKYISRHPPTSLAVGFRVALLIIPQLTRNGTKGEEEISGSIPIPLPEKSGRSRKLEV